MIWFAGIGESGKSSVVSLLSSLCSRNLETISLNSSSDTMDLLGGFEQADVGRSILELYAQVQLEIRDVLDEILEQSIVLGLELMEETVRLYGYFGSATQAKKRKRQMEVLKDLINLLQKLDKGNHVEMSEKLTLLRSSSKHGTFEWIESVLCRSLREGSWLVIDNVNLCSASVLDRLNALFEHGGKLTVSERGVLDGEVPEVVPHKDFRAFLLYDPNRGDISRAMRNRGVEVYVPSGKEVQVLPSDRMGLMANYLSSAIASDSTVLHADQLSYSAGFKQLTDKLSILGLQSLSGCTLKGSEGELVPLQHRLCWSLCSSNVWTLYPDLAKVCFQLLPVLELQADEDLRRISYNYFLHFFTRADSDLRQRIVSLILQSPPLTDICKKFSQNKLFTSLYEASGLSTREIWDRRIIPGHQDEPGDRSNRLSLILVTYSRFKELQEKVNMNPSCLLSKSSSSFKLSSQVLVQFPTIFMNILKAIEGELNQNSGMTDKDWVEFDSFLFWLYEVGDLGLRVPERSQEEDLERLLYVYWFWMEKKLSPLLTSLQLADLSAVFNKYHKIIQSSNYDSNAFSRFRSVTNLCPVPPQTMESVNILEQLYQIDTTIENRDIESRVEMIAGFCSRVEQTMLEHKNRSMDLGQVTADLMDIIKNCPSSGKCSSARFYRLQLDALSSRLVQLRGTEDPANSLLPLQLRLLLVENRDGMETKARLNLHYCRNPAKEIFGLEHSPVEGSLKVAENKVHSLHNVTSIVNGILLESSAGVPIVAFEEKQEQISNLVNILKRFQSPDPLSQLTSEFTAGLKVILNGLGKSYDLEESSISMETVLEIKDLDPNVKNVLVAISTAGSIDSMFTAHLNLILLNLLKLHIYGCLGAIDPAEKQALKYKQTLKELTYIRNQVLVIDKFQGCVGTLHPHRPVLRERELLLERLSSSIECRTAERGNQSFSLLSNTVKHFKDSLGSVGTVVKLVQDLRRVYTHGAQGTTLPETVVWIKSSTKFSSDLLQHFAFPDLVLPIVEAVAGCVVSVEAAVEEVNQKMLRDRFQNLEKVIMVVSDPVIEPEETLFSWMQFCLEPTISSLLENNQDLKTLRTILIFIKQSSLVSPNLKVPSNLVQEVVSRILRAWRTELELKKKQELEDEATFKSRTVCKDEDEEKEAEEEFKALFPTFKELFADLTNTDTLNEVMAVDEEEKPTFSPTRLNIIKEIAGFVLNYVTTEGSEGFQDLRRSDFKERLRSVHSLISAKVGVNSFSLEVGLIPALATLANSFLCHGEKPRYYNFYVDSNEEETKLMKPLLLALGAFIDKLLEEFPENPLLLTILVLRDRILNFGLDSPLSKNLTGLELLLGSCQEWEKNAHRGVSVQTMMDNISTLILRWRKLELSNWKPLLIQSLENIRSQSSEFWLHVMGVVLEARNKTDTVRALIQFVEASSLADFKTRLEILKSAQKILQLVGSNKKWLVAALENIHQYYTRFKESIDTRLESHFKTSEKQIGEFIKMARWKDTNFWSVRAMIDKTRKVLHKALREYKKAVSLPCKAHFIDEGSPEAPSAEERNIEVQKVLRNPVKPAEPKVLQSILNLKQVEVGTFTKLSQQAHQLSVKINQQLGQFNMVGEIADLVPELVSEMEKLTNLQVNQRSTKEEQKKQAGFIQQRKRRALNDLFKTLQSLGLSYRHGLMNCSVMNTNEELFYKLETDLDLWKDCEKYFFR